MISLGAALVIRLALVAILPGLIAIAVMRIGTHASKE